MRWHNSKWAALALAATAACGLVRAQDLPAVVDAPAVAVSLIEYLDLVRRNNPALRADAQRIEAARADITTAGALPNPSLSYSHKRGEREAGVEQPLPIFGQRGMRIEGARLALDTARAQAWAAQTEALREAARGFTALLVAQERQLRWQAAQQELDDAARIVAGQVGAGARSRYDLARIEVQQAQTVMEVARAQAALDESAAKVSAAAALPQWRPRVVGTLQVQPGETLPLEPLWDQAQRQLPALRAARAEEEQAVQRIDLERREALPTPAVSVGRLRNDDGRSPVIGLSVEIPLFDRRQGAVARAQAEREEARLRREAAFAQARTELQRAATQLDQRRTLADRFARQGLDRLPELRQMARDAYALGQGSILELIDSITSVAEKQIGYLELVEDVLQAELDLRIAAGDLPGGAQLLP